MFKFITEFAPLITFFIGYKTQGILSATLYMLVASIICISIMYIKERKVNNVNIVSTALLLVSSSLTLFSGNSTFIKMKPTVLYCIFACVFLVTNYKWSPAIKHVLGHAIKFRDIKNWRVLNIRFMWFFLTMAVINELVWRNFQESTWVSFKVFGSIPIIFIFIITQIPFITKNQQDDDSVNNFK